MKLYECPACEGRGNIYTKGREMTCQMCLGKGSITEIEVRKHFGRFADHYIEKHESKQAPKESEGK